MTGLRAWWSIVALMAFMGIVLNLLDLTVKSHFTLNPDIGLKISTAILLLSTGIYLSVKWLGSWLDFGSLAYLERNLSAIPEE